MNSTFRSYALVLAVMVVFPVFCLAVTSQITTHSTAEELTQGEAENVVIGSYGTLQLSRASEQILDEFEDVWAINSIVESGGELYIGTSPNGGVYKFSMGKLTKIYPVEEEKIEEETVAEEEVVPVADVNTTIDPNAIATVDQGQYLTNEHIFAMASDLSGRLIVGVSGRACKLMRISAGKIETIFEPNEETKYIFSIITANDGDIYVGTGPEGKIYRLDSLGKDPQIFYETTEKNVLSLACGDDGSIYAGTDTSGLIYKIDPQTKKASVLYDSEQPEITALLFSEGNLYAAATSAEVLNAQQQFAAGAPAGKPEQASKNSDQMNSGNGLRLKVANTEQSNGNNKGQRPPQMPPQIAPAQGSFVYKITPDGFVTSVYSKPAVFFDMALSGGELLLATGNKAELIAVDAVEERHSVNYTDRKASQLTAITVAGKDVYIGTANPAKILKLSADYAKAGTYSSSLIDAGQPAKWGKLQVEANIPAGCKVILSSRSGNVNDQNSPTWSEWTNPVEISEPVQLRCPNARFCQYKLTLESADGKKTPTIDKVAVASTVPNLAPQVQAVNVARHEAPDKPGVFKVSFMATDSNNDTLVYEIAFRKTETDKWVTVTDELAEPAFEWDAKTVEDGRYELKVTASDKKSNATTEVMTGARLSDVFVVDNTPPAIAAENPVVTGSEVTIKVTLTDEFSAVANLSYTVDSNTDWQSTVPEDGVYDTTEENFELLISELEPGNHVIALKGADDAGNTAYKSYYVEIGK